MDIVPISSYARRNGASPGGAVAMSSAGITTNGESTFSVSSVAYAPDWTALASAGSDGTVRIWDISTGQQRHQLIGHQGPVNSVAYGRRGNTVASGGSDGTVRIWDAHTGLQRHQLTGHQGPVNSVAYAPWESMVASAGSDGTVRIWDAHTGLQRHQLTGHQGPVNSVAYAPWESMVASAGSDGTVRIWDAHTGLQRHQLTGHQGPVNSVAYARQGNTVASGGSDGTVRIWDIGTGQHQLTGHQGPVNSVAYARRGNTVASGGSDGTVRIWDIGTRQQRHQFTVDNRPMNSVAYAPWGTTVASGGSDGTVRIWDARIGQRHQFTSDASSADSVASRQNDGGSNWGKLDITIVSALVLFGLLLIKVYGVAGYSLETAASLVTAQSVSVIAGTLALYSYLAMALLAVVSIYVIVIGFKDIELRKCAWVAVPLAVLGILLTPGKYLIDSLVLLAGVLVVSWLLPAIVYNGPRKDAEVRWTLNHFNVGTFHRVAVFFSTLIVLLFFLSTISQPWVPAEIVKLRDQAAANLTVKDPYGTRTQYPVVFVVGNENGNIALLLDSDRDVIYVDPHDIVSQRICNLNNEPEGDATILERILHEPYTPHVISCWRCTDQYIERNMRNPPFPIWLLDWQWKPLYSDHVTKKTHHDCTSNATSGKIPVSMPSRTMSGGVRGPQDK